MAELQRLEVNDHVTNRQKDGSVLLYGNMKISKRVHDYWLKSVHHHKYTVQIPKHH